MILFRCDANPQLGFGHLMRCRTLAGAVREELGLEVAMIGAPVQYATDQDRALFAEWIEVREWAGPEADAAMLLGHVRRLDASFAVLDDYRTDFAYQQALQAASLPCLKFDGTARHALLADIVVNANPSVSAADYRDVLRNPQTRLLTGPGHALLRSEFPPARNREHTGRVERVLLTFGGGDDRGAIRTVLAALASDVTREIRFIVVSGAHNPRNEENRAWIEQNCSGRVDYHIAPPSVAELMASCDLAVMAGGTSTYEAASAGLPMLLVAIAENQVAQAHGWEAEGIAIFLGPLEQAGPEQVLAAFTDMISEPARLAAQSMRARRLVSGEGRRAVARAIGEQVSRNQRRLSLTRQTGC